MTLDKNEAIKRLEDFNKIFTEITNEFATTVAVYNRIIERFEFTPDKILLAKSIQTIKLYTLKLFINNFDYIKQDLGQLELDEVLNLFSVKLNESLAEANIDLKNLEAL